MPDSKLYPEQELVLDLVAEYLKPYLQGLQSLDKKTILEITESVEIDLQNEFLLKDKDEYDLKNASKTRQHWTRCVFDSVLEMLIYSNPKFIKSWIIPMILPKPGSMVSLRFNSDNIDFESFMDMINNISKELYDFASTVQVKT